MPLSKDPVHNFSVTNCRVCLKTGHIPIFGSINISEQITIFGHVQIEVQDDFPKYICNNCNTMLQNAILFRKTAQTSDRLLRYGDVFENDEVKIEHSDTNTDEKSDIREHFKMFFEENKDPLKIEEHSESDIGEKFYYTEHCDNEDIMNNDIILKIDPDYGVDEEMNENEPYITCQYLEYGESSSDEINDDKPKDTFYITYDSTCKELREVKAIKASNENRNKKDDMVVASNKNDGGNDSAETRVNFECNVCNEIFKSPEDLKEHNLILNCRNSVKCDVCGVIVDKTSYRTHLQHHTDTYKRKWEKKYHKIECEICEAPVSKSYYNIHMRKHGTKSEKAKTRRTCQYCNKTYHTGYFAYHLKRIHGKSENVQSDEKVIKGPEEQQYKRCPICSRNVQKQRLKEHLAMHGKPPKQYICDQCGKVSIHRSAFKLHCMTHGAELKHKCQYCPYRALHSGLLKVHLRTHTKDYKYHCTECPSRFITKSNLTMHQRKHSRPDDFKCDICNKTFFSKRNLAQHNTSKHLGIRNVICNICGKGFGHRNGMLNHQKKVHKTKNITNRVGRMPSYLIQELKNTEEGK